MTRLHEWCVAPHSDDIEVDPDAPLSFHPGSGGCWVQAWVWVYDDEISRGGGS